MIGDSFSKIFIVLSFLALQVSCDSSYYYGPSTGLIIGLTIGIPLLIFIICSLCVCYMQKRRMRQIPGGQIISAQPVMTPPQMMYHSGPIYTQQSGMYPQGNTNPYGGFLPSNPPGTAYLQNGAQFQQGIPDAQMGSMNHQFPPPYPQNGWNLPSGTNETSFQETQGKP